MTDTSPAEASGGSADTLGWDTVFAVTTKKVNEAIVSRKQYPKALQFKQTADPNAFPPIVTSLEADFGPWQICEGGDGPEIWFQVPMQNVRGECVDDHLKTVSFQIADFTLVVKVKLTILEATAAEIAAANKSSGKAPPSGTTKKKLVARTTTENEDDPVAAIQTINWNKVTITPETLAKEGLRYGIEPALTTWFNENLVDFEHIFTLLDIYDRADTGQFAFLKPRHASYAYVDRGSLDTSLLAMLCMTSDDPPPAQQQVSSFSIPDGQHAGFLLSSRRMFADMMLPMFEKVWKHAKADDFSLDEDGLGITLKAGKSIQLKDVSPSPGVSYTPYLKQFTIRLEHDILRTDAYTETKISPGIVADCHSTHWSTVALGEGKNGQTLKFVQAKKGEVDHEIKNHPVIDKTDSVLAKIGLVAGLLLLMFAGGVELLVGGLILFLVTGLMPMTVGIIDSVNHDDAPDIDLLTMNAVDPIQWTDSGDFQLQTAGLRNSLQLGGLLK